MRFNKRYFTVLISAMMFYSCGSGQSTNSSSSPGTKIPNGISLPVQSGINVIPVTVNGSLCSSGSYINKPCVTVTVCTPGTSSCQTISDILLDTGSTGLRVFKQALSVSLPRILVSGRILAECVQFGDGSSDWGTVSRADIYLGGEPSVTVPVQVIDSTVVGESAHCPGSDSGPSAAGFNGILGVGLFAQDCGRGCDAANDPGGNNGLYFSCSSINCGGSSVELSNQLQNPVFALPVDNNGVILEFPQVPPGGASFVNGYMVMGIGTRTNNVPTGVITYGADPWSGEFTSFFNGTQYPSFIDSGSNATYFPSPSSSQFPDCGGSSTGLFCPASTISLSANNIGDGGSPSGALGFSVGNALNLVHSGGAVFSEIGGSNSSAMDWGITFHFGRNVYVGIENTASALGTGPYWAY
jgi:hypothetical protein